MPVAKKPTPAPVTIPTTSTTSTVPPAPKAGVATGGAAKKVTAAPPAVPAKPAAATKTAPVVAAKVVDSVVQDPVDDKGGEKVGENLINSLLEKFNTMNAQMKEMQTLLKLLSREYDKQQKIIDKVQKKRQNAKNSPSGFAKPNKISNELCDFIGVPHGTEKSRTDITRFINAYVKEHNLNNPENRRFIIPDAKLKAILNVKDGEEINYFILQKLISHHFPPSASKQQQAARA
jgi:chromatin remodeling complex protein RSC6